jgi:hypothetical protein
MRSRPPVQAAEVLFVVRPCNFLDRFWGQAYSPVRRNLLGLQQCGGVVTYREKSPFIPTAVSDQEFENLLKRSSAIFRQRSSRLIRFPAKPAPKRVQTLKSR